MEHFALAITSTGSAVSSATAGGALMLFLSMFNLRMTGHFISIVVCSVASAVGGCALVSYTLPVFARQLLQRLLERIPRHGVPLGDALLGGAAGRFQHHLRPPQRVLNVGQTDEAYYCEAGYQGSCPTYPLPHAPARLFLASAH